MSSSITVKPFNPASPSLAFTIETVNLDSYDCKSVMSEDGVTPKALKFLIAGTGLMSTTDWEALRTALARPSSRCNEITLSHGTPPKQLIGLTRSASVIGGPTISISAQSIAGSGGLALVRFEISDEVQYSGLNVLAHTWSQNMRLDATGVATRSVSGHLRVWRGSAEDDRDPSGFATRTNWITTIPWADVFRAAAVPLETRQGWRRESQEFVLDANGTELIYSLVDKQYAHELPDGVRVGDFDFTYERSIENPGMANVTFSCELEGGHDLRGTPGMGSGMTGNRLLIAAALQLSRTRINANLKTVLITSLKVTELSVLTKFAIRLEISAQLLPNADQANAGVILQPLAEVVGRAFFIRRTTTRIIPPYGLPYPQAEASENGVVYPPVDGDVYAMVAHYLQVAGSPQGMPPYSGGAVQDVWLDAMQNGHGQQPMPSAQLVYLKNDCVFGTGTQSVTNPSGVSVYIVQPNNSGTVVQAMNEQIGGRWSDKQENLLNPDDDQLISYATGTTRCDVDTGIVIASRMQPEAVDAVFQVRHPMVLITERVEIVQLNKAPQRQSRALPKGAWIKSQRWDVSFGKLDAQGNRTYIGIFERTYQMRDVGLQTVLGTYARNKSGFMSSDLAQTSESGLVVNPTFGKVRVWDPITNYSAVAAETGPNLNAPLIPTVKRSEQDAMRSTIDSLNVNPEQSYRPSDPLSTGVVRE